MADTYRYPLTRICLRTGSLTLPLNLLGVFPERGDVIAVDPQKDAEFALRVEGRRILGMAAFFEAHELTVNDELTIRPLEDGRYAITAVARPRRPDVTRPEFIGRLLDGVVEAGVPVSEDEIRGLHPEIPAGFPLRQALEREPRLTLREGRWQRRLAEPPEAPADGPSARTKAGKAAERRGHDDPATDRREAERLRQERREAIRTAAQRAQAEAQAAERAPAEHGRAEAQRAERAPAERSQAEAQRAEREEAARARAEIDAANAAQAEREAEILRMVQEEELAQVVGTVMRREGAPSGTVGPGFGDEPGDDVDLDDGLDFARRRSRERLAAHAEDDVQASARRQRDARAERRRSDAGQADEPESFGWDQPLIRRLRFPWSRRREEPKESAPEPAAPVEDPLKLDRLGEPRPVDRNAPPAPRVVPAPRAGLFAADAGLNSATLPPGDPAATKRAREAFTSLGYRVEGLAHGQLMLHADYGRRFERILVHVLPDGQRLEWAALLARRREAAATHLAVVGDHRDLHRLLAPADYAKATLWSWAGLERVRELAATMPISPADLDPHFEHDGLFDYGLERFERTIAKRVQERGALSTVLERLAQLKAPAVFMIEDVVGGADLSREQALRVLERLCEAPWHLVQRVDSGEFCLRYRVHEALDQIGTYATSLRARLPERQRDLVRGLPDDLDPIDAEDVVGHAGATSPQDAAPAPALEAVGPTANATPAADPAATPDAREPAPVPTARGGESSQPRLVPDEQRARGRPFAGPGLGEDEADPDEVDVSLVAVKRRGRRR